MQKIVLSVVAFFITIVVSAQCVSNVNFNTWAPAGYPSNGQWSVQNGGSQVYQGNNGDQAFYVSPYDLMNVHISGTFRSNDTDDDWMGFVFSFLNPINPIDTFDCWLFDWKQKQQNGAQRGMSVCRLNGYIPNSYPGISDHPQFWDHTASPAFTVVANNWGSAGWQIFNNHNFDLYLTYSKATIYVDGNLEFEINDCFKPGRFGFYNLSQSDCIYSNFQYELFVDFWYPDQGACVGTPASFRFIDPCVTSLGQYQSLVWNFGDGQTQTINNPTLANVNVTHTYATAGNYTATLTLTDLNGCSASATHAVDVRAPIGLTPTITQPLCNGAANGGITLATTGGFGNFTYNWSNNTTGNSLVGGAAGTYTLTITDGRCVTTAQYTLNQPTPVTATTSHTDASCSIANGTATITIAGGTPPYSGINWGPLPNMQGNTATGLGPGHYIADFHDANGCSALLQYGETISSLPCGISSSTSVTNVVCRGQSTGSATLTVTGSTGTPVITWNPGGNTGPTISNKPAGTYTYTYTDADPAHNFNGSVTITEPPSTLTAQMTTTAIACPGTNSGQAVASVTAGGTSPYNYSWSPAQTNSPVASNLAPGPYSVTITDANTCTATATGTVSGIASLNVTFTTIIDSCYLSNKGSAFSHVTGGTPPYTYAWNNFVNDTANVHISAGTYTLTVTDFNGCSVSAQATITGPAAPVTRVVTKTQILCAGQSTGSINLAVSGGTGSYTYVWNPNTLSGPNNTGLAAGIYSYTVSDIYGCRVTGDDTLTQPATALTATSSHTNVTCPGANNGTLTLTVGGGTPPYSFLGNPVPAGTTVVPGRAAGTYAGNVTDANGCTVAVSETITEPGPQSLTVSNTNEPCNGATSATASANFVNATGAVNYSWTGGLTGPNQSNLSPGTYNITATDANLCSVTGTVTVTEPAAPVMTVTTVDAACFGANGSATANPTGGGTFNYTWSSNGSNTQTITPPAGNYTVTATDASSCNQTAAFVINQPGGMSVQIQKTNVLCFGASTGAITITTTGGSGPGYTYTWNPNVSNTNSATSLAANTYNVRITDQANCNLDTAIVINQPAAPLANVVAATNVTCFGANDGTITITTTGGTTNYSYVWSPNVSTTNAATGLGANNYSISVTDANGCSLVETAIITEPTQLTLTQAQTNILCFGATTGDATVTVAGGTPNYTYAWTNNVSSTNTATALGAGTYNVTATDASTCTITATFTLTQPAQLTLTNVHTDVSCFGGANGTIDVTAGGGVPGYTYAWTNNVSTGTSATGLTAATYGITVTDANNCTVAKSVIVAEPTVLAVTATATAVSCNGLSDATITAVATGGTTAYSYSINTQTSSTGVYQNVPAGNYTVDVTDAKSCTATTTVTVNEPQAVTLALAPTDASCYGYTDGQIKATGGGGASATYTFALSNGTSNSTGMFTNLATGFYNVTVSDINNCSVSDTATINQPDSVTISVAPDPVTVNLGASLQLNTTTNASGTVSYDWQPAFGLSCYDCPNPVFNGNYSATYTATVINDLGCSGKATVTVTVIPSYDIFIPNVFTPNGDGANDEWKIFGNLTGIKQLQVMVFNRIGEKVFESNDINFGWDGTYKGTSVPGVYTYVAKFVWLNNHSDNSYHGSITLLK
jgi:gliding motility-associated-like protein